jgi:multiple sugar transport system substrate-binding protein
LATIKDVAKLADVSISTVSLVINGKRNISTEKYNEILAAMKELNYRPNMIAQNLKKQKFHIIGVILPSIDEHHAQILKGIHDVLDAEKYHIIVKTSGNSVQKEEEIFEDLISIGVSGIIAVACDTENTEKYRKWTQTGLPAVFLERRITSIEFCNVLFDNQKLIYNKTKELLERYKPEELALITGPQKFSNERECVTGFQDAVSETFPGCDPGKLEIVETSMNVKRAMFDLLSRFGGNDIKETCFLVSGMEIAEILLEIQNLMKRDVRIYALGGDIWSLAEKNRSYIRTIPREASRMGQSAARLMMSFVKHKRVEEIRDILIETRYECGDTEKRGIVPLSGKRPLRVMLLQSNAMDVLQKMSPNFTKETGIPVEFTIKPFFELTHRLVADPDNAPEHDVLWVDIPLVETMTRMGRLMDLSPWIERDKRDILSTFPKGVLKCVYDDKKQIYGIPILMDEGLLHYRKDVFSDPALKRSFFNKYGFELSPPKTWTEYNYVAEFLDGSWNPESPFGYGTVLSLTSPTALMEEFYIRQWAFGGRMIDKWGKLCIDSIENVRALENLAAAYKHSPPECIDYFFEESFNRLLTGDVPMLCGFPTHYLPFKHAQLSMNCESQISVAPLPGGKPLLGGWLLGVNAKTDMPDEAYEFLCWTIREDLAVMRGLLGNLIPVNATYNNSLLNNSYPGLKMMNIAQFSKGLREVIHTPEGKVVDQFQFERAVADSFCKAIRGEITAPEALKHARESTVKLMQSVTY